MATNNAINAPLPLALTQGGTAASLTASNGGIIYSGSSALAVLSGTATARQMLQSGASGAPAWSTAVFPATTTINQLLYSSSANNVVGLATTNSAVLSTTSAGVPTWIGSLTNGQLVIGSTGATPVAATITQGTGISVTNGAGTITIASTATSITWVDVTGGTQTLAVNTGYIADNAGGVAFTLPTTAAQGTLISICGNGAGGWSIAQNAGQSINVGNAPTTTGVTGSLASSNAFDQVDFLCVVANTTWNVRSMVGNLTVV